MSMTQERLQMEIEDTLEKLLNKIQAKEPELGRMYKAYLKLQIDDEDEISEKLTNEIVDLYLSIKGYRPISTREY